RGLIRSVILMPPGVPPEIFLLEANLVLQDAIERIYVGNRFGDIPRGIFLIRGENVVLMGEVVSLCWQVWDNNIRWGTVGLGVRWEGRGPSRDVWVGPARSLGCNTPPSQFHFRYPSL